MSEYRDFSSLPPDKEQQFVVFEKTSVESAAKAKKLGLIVSLTIGVIVVIVVLSFDKPKNLMAEDDAKAAALKKSEEAPKEAPKPDPATTTPATTTPATTTPATTEAAPSEGEPSEGEAPKTDG